MRGYTQEVTESIVFTQASREYCLLSSASGSSASGSCPKIPGRHWVLSVSAGGDSIITPYRYLVYLDGVC